MGAYILTKAVEAMQVLAPVSQTIRNSSAG
jgi:hypothetical protein